MLIGHPKNTNAKGGTSNLESKPVLHSAEPLTDPCVRIIGAAPEKAKNWIPVLCVPAHGKESGSLNLITLAFC